MLPAYGYLPGCSLKGTGVAYEESLITLFGLLDLWLEELPDWNRFGATSYMSIDEGAAFALSARNLAPAHEGWHRQLLAPCSACYLVLRKTQDYVQKYVQIGRRVRESLRAAKLPELNSVRVRHPLDVLYTAVGVERIRSTVKRVWRGGPVACYYGCQLRRTRRRAEDQKRNSAVAHKAFAHTHGDSRTGYSPPGIRPPGSNRTLKCLAYYG